VVQEVQEVFLRSPYNLSSSQKQLETVDSWSN